MSDLHQALHDIRNIRRQLASNTEFRGYGPSTLALTSLIALAAGSTQPIFVRDPAGQPGAYLLLWSLTAAVCATLTCIEMYARTHRVHTGMSNEMLQMAVEQFLPAIGAGLLVMLVLALYAPSAIWTLPGIWQVLFSLGIFSSCRFLPRRMLLAGAWFLTTGLLCLAVGDNRALSPFAMALPFGGGQLLVAAILFVDGRKPQYDE